MSRLLACVAVATVGAWLSAPQCASAQWTIGNYEVYAVTGRVGNTAYSVDNSTGGYVSAVGTDSYSYSEIYVTYRRTYSASYPTPSLSYTPSTHAEGSAQALTYAKSGGSFSPYWSFDRDTNYANPYDTVFAPSQFTLAPGWYTLYITAHAFGSSSSSTNTSTAYSRLWFQ